MRTLLLTTLIVLAISFSATAQNVAEKSPQVKAQIEQNAATGADEWNGISKQFRFTFNEQLTPEETAGIDRKLMDLYSDIRSCKTSSSSGGSDITLQFHPSVDYSYVKSIVGRFGFNYTDVQEEYVLTTKQHTFYHKTLQ